MGTNGAPLVADVFLFCYKRDLKTLLQQAISESVLWRFSLFIQKSFGTPSFHLTL